MLKGAPPSTSLVAPLMPFFLLFLMSWCGYATFCYLLLSPFLVLVCCSVLSFSLVCGAWSLASLIPCGSMFESASRCQSRAHILLHSCTDMAYANTLSASVVAVASAASSTFGVALAAIVASLDLFAKVAVTPALIALLSCFCVSYSFLFACFCLLFCELAVYFSFVFALQVLL
jgi:hypothetical protein